MAGFDPPIIVLVVDDDRLTRTVMSRMLTRLGCNVSTAENGEIALEMIISGLGTSEAGDGPNSRVPNLSHDSEKDQNGEGTGNGYVYDAIFLDNQMPVMSGLELVSKLREMGRADFVIGVTGECCSSVVPLIILTLKQAMHSSMTRESTPRRVWTSTWFP
jgi:CheY-like chemotaxis protein